MEGILNAKYILLYACVVAVYVEQIDGSSCFGYTACEKCIRNACVWCNENSADYENRTRCMEESELLASGCKDHNKAKPSTYIVNKTKKESIFSPQNVGLFLEYGNPVTIPVEIKIPGNIRQQSTLILKYFEQRATYKQTISMENGPISRTSRKKRKSIIKIDRLDADSTIKLNVTLETTKCRAIKHKTTIVARLVQKMRKPKKYRFTIILRGNCPCSCREHEKNSVKCSERGWYGCGICHCDDGYTGSSCEVDAQPNRMCMRPNSSAVCNDRGSCVSGLCECHLINRQRQQRYSGRYCECNDYSCPYGTNNRICSGNGLCTCGECLCNEGFTGSDCGCSMSPNSCMASNGEICNGRGLCECGICNCDTGYTGSSCELDAQTSMMCMNPRTNVVCSGRGNCVSGMCECYPINPSVYENKIRQMYSGRYCECNDYSCPYGANNTICSGNGRCSCGVCQCNAGFTGSECDCPMSQNTCMALNGMICNGRGVCECGTCRCDPESYYRGPTCEECPTCPGGCFGLKPCVECVAFGSGELDRRQCNARCYGNSTSFSVVDELKDGDTRCVFRDGDGCLFRFSYTLVASDNDVVTKVDIQSTKECPP